ncbi:hypothetical protein L1887_31472 [Cichorium endivia]|nr:hypothetical protein L1887_31472 [Cichorium endivia]
MGTLTRFCLAHGTCAKEFYNVLAHGSHVKCAWHFVSYGATCPKASKPQKEIKKQFISKQKFPHHIKTIHCPPILSNNITRTRNKSQSPSCF